MSVLRAFSKQAQNSFQSFKEKISHETLANILDDLSKGTILKINELPFVLNTDRFYLIRE